MPRTPPHRPQSRSHTSPADSRPQHMPIQRPHGVAIWGKSSSFPVPFLLSIAFPAPPTPLLGSPLQSWLPPVSGFDHCSCAPRRNDQLSYGPTACFKAWLASWRRCHFGRCQGGARWLQLHRPSSATCGAARHALHRTRLARPVALVLEPDTALHW